MVYNKEYEKKRKRPESHKLWKRDYMREYVNKEYKKDPTAAKKRQREYYAREKAKMEPSVLIGRWHLVAKDLLTRGDMPTETDLKIIGILAYTMNITAIELMKFLAGLKPTVRSLKQIKQWLDFREQYLLEDELPEEIRERHRIVNANYGRIEDFLNEEKKT